jgi:hypothetical protein
MENCFYEMGYDILGRRAVVDGNGEYVTHIPGNVSEDEVLKKLRCGEPFRFDARNQGMQNIPGAQVDTSVKAGIAPRDEWPMHDAWRQKWIRCEDTGITFEEFREEYFKKSAVPDNSTARAKRMKNKKHV